MKHREVIEKFLIQYDKDMLSTSYPALTTYEIKTFLDKAYLALIAQKLTGNNQRRVPIEGDVKAVDDLSPLIVQDNLADQTSLVSGTKSSNELIFDLPTNYLHYVSARLQHDGNIDQNIRLVSHDTAQQFRVTATNKPWVKEPVAFIGNDKIHVLYDIRKYSHGITGAQCIMQYVKEPVKFVDTELNSADDVEMEISDAMVEELINLAIVMVAENVESGRFTTKSQERALEA